MYAASLSRVLPPVALIAKHAWGVPARAWAAGSCVALILGDAGARLLGAKGINNLWLGYITNPAVGIAMLFALAYWQQTSRSQRMVRALAPIFALTWVSVVVLAEDLNSFSVVAFPLQALLLLVLSLSTLVANGLSEGGSMMLGHDWFWICCGFALSSGAASAIEPLSAMFLRSAPDRLLDLFNFKAGIDLAAALAITVGMLCPVTAAPSGPSSSPAR